MLDRVCHRARLSLNPLHIYRNVWITATERADVVRASDLATALRQAVRTIRTWHGMGMGKHEAQAWALYQASPEMQAINAVIANATKPDTEHAPTCRREITRQADDSAAYLSEPCTCGMGTKA